MTRVLLLLVLLFGAPLALPTPAAAQANTSIKCWSWNYQRNRCPIDLRGATVFKQVDQSRLCGPQNFNWGYDNTGIWVNGGCQAIFGVQYQQNGGYRPPPPPAPVAPGLGNGRVIRCESLRYQPQRCALDVYGPPQIQQVFGGQCTRGQDWGWDRGGIWVNNGCRANFFVAGRPGSGPGGPGYNPGIGNGAGWNGGGTIIECSSWQYKPARCPAMITHDVQIVSVIGGECVRNRSWGFDGGAVWVNNGCRARFRVF